MPLTLQKQRSIVDFYTKEKLSISQVSDKLHLAESSVIYYLKKYGVVRRSRSEAVTLIYRTRFNKKQFHLRMRLSPKDETLKAICVALYWCEGAKTGGAVKFVNSDPDMIKVFLTFLRRICGIDENRLKAIIHYYPDLNEGELKRFWSSITKIPFSRFYRSYRHQGRVGTYKKKSLHGTLAVNYSDTILLRKILSWIEEYRDLL